MAANYLWILGSLIITGLGTIHLVLTFFSKMFSPRNEKLENDMNTVNPILTKQTTMWKAWIGFNASHSIGAMFFGLLNSYLAIKHFNIMQSENFFFFLDILTIGFYFWLAKKYWFKIPLIGIAITFFCYLISFVLTNF
jgi:hypothetical protein